jgi:hypothetical protein
MSEMKRKIQTKEDYLKSASEFKQIIDRWVRLYNKMSLTFGASSTTDLLKVGKSLEKGADIFDDMMSHDIVSPNIEFVSIYFYNCIELSHPNYNCSQSEKEKCYPDPGKTLPICLYENIAHDLRVFSNDLMGFTIDLQKYHGKTRIRVLLDSDRPMNHFYFGLESRMYKENPDNRDLSKIF